MESSFSGSDDIDGVWKYICSNSPKPEIKEMQPMIGCRLIDDNQVRDEVAFQITKIIDLDFHHIISNAELIDRSEELEGDHLSVL